MPTVEATGSPTAKHSVMETGSVKAMGLPTATPKLTATVMHSVPATDLVSEKGSNPATRSESAMRSASERAKAMALHSEPEAAAAALAVVVVVVAVGAEVTVEVEEAAVQQPRPCPSRHSGQSSCIRRPGCRPSQLFRQRHSARTSRIDRKVSQPRERLCPRGAQR